MRRCWAAAAACCVCLFFPLFSPFLAFFCPFLAYFRQPCARVGHKGSVTWIVLSTPATRFPPPLSATSGGRFEEARAPFACWQSVVETGLRHTRTWESAFRFLFSTSDARLFSGQRRASFRPPLARPNPANFRRDPLYAHAHAPAHAQRESPPPAKHLFHRSNIVHLFAPSSPRLCERIPW